MAMLTHLANVGGRDAATVLTQLLAKIKALELDNKALKAKVANFEHNQPSSTASSHPGLAPASVPEPKQTPRGFGNDAMELDNYGQSLTERSFPKPLTRSPASVNSRQELPPNDTKGKGSLTRGQVGDLDLAFDDDGQKLIMYIPSSCFTAIVEPDVNDRRKLGDFRKSCFVSPYLL